MFGVKKKSYFLLSDIKKLTHFYVVTKCPLVYTNVWKIHEIDAAKYMCSAKHLKNKTWWLCYKFIQKSASKDFINTFPPYFFTTFFHNIQQTFFATTTKTSKKQILTVALQNYAKINFKKLYKNLSYLFLTNFFPTCFKETLSKHYNNSDIIHHLN